MTNTSVSDHPVSARLPSVRRLLAVGGCGLGLLAAGIYGIRWWETGRFLVATDNAYVRADVVTITPRVAGIVTEVVVGDNQQVKAGDILAKIDDRDYRATVERSEGAVASAQAAIKVDQANIANIEAQKTQQQSVIADKAAAVVASEEERRLADVEYQRQLNMSHQQATSAQSLQSAESNARKAAATLEGAKAALDAARSYVAVLAAQAQAASAEVEKAQGDLSQAKAALTSAQLDLERTAIRSPVDGLVGQRVGRGGQYAEVGTPILAVVPKSVYVVANYKETQTGAIKIGQPVDIVVDAFGGRVLKGHVDSFAPASGAQFALLPPDNATGNFTKIVQRMPVRISIDEPEAALSLRPGMSVEATVNTREGAR